MSKSTNENEKPSHVATANEGNATSNLGEAIIKNTSYDNGTVEYGPPPLQACNSCKFFTAKKIIKKDKRPALSIVLGDCQFNNAGISQNLDSVCWLFQRSDKYPKLQPKVLNDASIDTKTSS